MSVAVLLFAARIAASGEHAFGARQGVSRPLVPVMSAHGSDMECGCDAWPKVGTYMGVQFCHLGFWYGRRTDGKVWQRGVSGCMSGCVLRHLGGQDYCFKTTPPDTAFILDGDEIRVMEVMVALVTKQLDAFAALLGYLKTAKINTWAKRYKVGTMLKNAMTIATADQKEKLKKAFGIGDQVMSPGAVLVSPHQ